MALLHLRRAGALRRRDEAAGQGQRRRVHQDDAATGLARRALAGYQALPGWPVDGHHDPWRHLTRCRRGSSLTSLIGTMVSLLLVGLIIV